MSNNVSLLTRGWARGVLLSFTLAVVCASIPVVTLAEQGRRLAPAGVRAVWLRPLIGANVEVRRSPQNARVFIRAELAKIKRAGFDTVYVESYFDGYTIYPSAVATQRPLSMTYGVATRDDHGRVQTWDVLNTYLTEGRRIGLSMHGWFQVFYAWHTGLGDVSNSPIFGPHPEWLALDASGSPMVRAEPEGSRGEISKIFMSPSNRGARAYLIRLVGELAKHYPNLDGIQLDFIRYPSHELTPFDYSADALRQFTQATGLDARQISSDKTPREWARWQEWKAEQVTATVRALSRTIRSVRPQMIISAAVYPGFQEDLRLKMQDTRKWARLGLIDVLLPMLYGRDIERLDAWAREFRAGVDQRTRIYPALFIGDFYEPKSNRLDNRYLSLSERHGFDGIGLFAAQFVTDELATELSDTDFGRMAVKKSR
jgi:uncharacterized lipoprotein YddW (UPF0748 family)